MVIFTDGRFVDDEGDDDTASVESEPITHHEPKISAVIIPKALVLVLSG